MQRNQKVFSQVLYFIMLFFVWATAAGQPATGSLKGIVVDEATDQPLIGVNILVQGEIYGTASDLKGHYAVTGIPAGTYNVVYRYMGYEKLVRTDVVINPGRITQLDISLKESVISGEEVVVTEEYFQKEATEPTSVVQFNSEEIRRSPGSGGDVSRILMALPSTAQVADNSNDLMVRGGSPTENAFYVDNIQIPNVNHFPTQGSSSGAIGMLNVDFIQDVTFSTGGFSAAYGDKLSSVVNIDFREGNREEFDTQLDMSLSGFGGVIEGPLPDKNGSWFISGRKSYLDLLIDAIGTGSAPRYGDVHGKVSYNLNSQHKISLLNIYGTSMMNVSKANALENDLPTNGDFAATQNTTGLSWRYLWGEKGYSNTSLSYGFTQSEDLWHFVTTDRIQQSSSYLEGAARLRNVNTYKISAAHRLEFGLETEYDLAEYDYFFAEYTNRLGNTVPELSVEENFYTSKAGVFFNYSWQPAPQWIYTLGVRGDYYSFSENFHVAPRLAVSYRATDKLTLNASTGIYYQSLPMILLSQQEENRNLDDPRAVHYIAGVDYMLTPDTRFSLEVYTKEYSHLPMEPTDPTLFVIDDGRSLQHFQRYTALRDVGIAYSRGIELLLQKKLAKDFYGLISGTYFRSRYEDLTGEWRNRTYDNQYMFSVLGGYKPNDTWEFSLKWSYAGGVPYTPFDSAASKAAKAGIIDMTRINEVRYPAYHSLNLRADRRFYFNNSSLVLYASIWNAYNRENVAMYYWDEVKNEQVDYLQWSLIPIMGMEFEF